MVSHGAGGDCAGRRRANLYPGRIRNLDGEQRAEMQQDFRAASNMLTTDLSLAGAGLGNGAAIVLPSATTPQYGCDQTGTCYLNGVAGTYPFKSGRPTFTG